MVVQEKYHKCLQNTWHWGIAQESAGVLEVCFVPVPIWASPFTSSTLIPMQEMYHKWLRNTCHYGIAQESAGGLEVGFLPVAIWVFPFTSSTLIPIPEEPMKGSPRGLYYKTLRIRNLRKTAKFCRKRVLFFCQSQIH